MTCRTSYSSKSNLQMERDDLLGKLLQPRSSSFAHCQIELKPLRSHKWTLA